MIRVGKTRPAAVLFLAGIFLVVFLHVPARAFADRVYKDNTVRIVSFSFPPILHATETGNFSGTMGETVKMLCESGSLKCKFDVVSLKRAYLQLRNGDADALITINVGQLNDCCIASEWSSPWSAGFFSSAGADNIPETQKDLVGKNLVVVRGMKSPYAFAPDLDTMAKDGRLTLFKAPNILSSVKMFLRKRAPLLWGGEDFIWYIEKLDKNAIYHFKPFFEKPVVVWVRKDKVEILERLNHAFSTLKNSDSLDSRNLLIPSIMEQKYVDAPLKN